MDEPIYCKNCKYYKGEVKFDVRYPMGIGRKWDYICGFHEKSVFQVNIQNDCKDFEPKSLRPSFLDTLKFWKHESKKNS